MNRRYDLVVVGSGTAASGVAARVRQAGWRVALIDFRPLGGTCALRGCDPKKVLVGAAEAVDFVARMSGHGVSGEARIDWPALIDFKRHFTDPVPHHTEERLKQLGVDVLHGRARFNGSTRLEVGGGGVVEGRYVVLAAGAEPVKLGIPGEQHLATSEAFLSLPELPARIVFVGGGYIAAEFSYLAALAGASVIVLQHGERMLKRFDPDLVALLMEKSRRIGIDVRTRTKVEAIVREGSGFKVRASSDDGPLEVTADLVVHAAGRKADLDALNLPAANVSVRDGKLDLDEYLCSVSNRAVYATGDCAGKGPPLTPVASLDAEVVAENLLHGNRRRADYTGVPSVAFTLPPIAAVGLGEEEARSQGLRFRTHHEKASAWYTAKRTAESTYGFKTLIDEHSGRILGAHLVGPHADEVINLFALAIRNGLSADALKSTVFAYPTSASDLSSML
jgi:glutathione reductase (NADPH)